MANLAKYIVSLEAQTARYENKLDAANRRLKRFESQNQKSLKAVDNRFAALGRSVSRSLGALGVTLGAAGIAFGVKRLASSAKEYEQSLAKIVGLVGVSRAEVQGFSKDIERLAGVTARGPQELADALFFITSAGARGSEAIDILESSAKAATAGLGETATVADAVTSAVNAYGSENLKAAEAVDVLVAAVREGKAAADAIAPALGRVIPIAAEMGVEFSEVGATIAALTRVGSSAEESATALASVLTGVLKPGQEAEQTLSKFGLSVSGLRAKIRDDGLIDSLLLLKDRFGDNEEAMGKVFSNVRALRGVLGLVGANAETVATIFDSVANSAGSAEAAFAAMADTSSFKVDQAFARLEVSGNRLGALVLPPIAAALERIAGGADLVSEAVSKLTSTELEKAEKAFAVAQERAVELETLIDGLREERESLEALISDRGASLGVLGRNEVNADILEISSSLESLSAEYRRVAMEAADASVMVSVLGGSVSNTPDIGAISVAVPSLDIEAAIPDEAALAKQEQFIAGLRTQIDTLGIQAGDLENAETALRKYNTALQAAALGGPDFVAEALKLADAIDLQTKRLEEAKAAAEREVQLESVSGDLAAMLQDIEIDTLRTMDNTAEAIQRVARQQIDAIAEMVAELPELAEQAATVMNAVAANAAAQIAQLSEDAEQQSNEFANAFAAAFESRGVSALLDGKLSDAVQGFIKDIAELIIRLTIMRPLAEGLSQSFQGFSLGGGGGGGGGFLSKIAAAFKGGKAFGGVIPPNSFAVTGEDGPEFVSTNASARVIPLTQVPAIAGSGGMTINQYNDIQAGIPAQWAQQLRQVGELAASAAFSATAKRDSGKR